MPTSFPDQVHIDRIREALWSRRPFGNAAVLVGAGLSLNAKSATAREGSFPTWFQLAKRIVDHLYPEYGDGSNRQHEWALKQIEATSGALRLAQEYQAAFGRVALDRLIADSIPDERFEPGDLHTLLLDLPWSDVFTTNWDTLLERCARKLLDRHYDLVRTIPEIPRSIKPRIVKLHGSLPSNPPFILTEEDFRTYPRCFAPFVNLAQQSMMENVFCLIGFSGDDPNFLYWSGWVRDHLGESSPKIYLVGWLDLSSARRRMLEDRNVVPVDLARLPGAERWQEDLRHQEALRWFLANLRLAEPYDETNWPRVRSRLRIRTPDHWPAIPEPVAAGPQPERYGPPDGVPAASSLEAVLSEVRVWHYNRSLYPGWIVAPRSVRRLVWMYTERWIPRILKVLSEASVEQRFSILDELNWRLELCLIPLSPEIVAAIETALGLVDPVERTVGQTGDETNRAALDWPLVRRVWVGLAVARLRYARETDALGEFDDWSQRLRPFTAEHPWLASRISYERCLLGLSRLDHESVEQTLTRWNTLEVEPFWEIRKASVLAEIGKTAEAYAMSFGALEKIRSQNQKDRVDIASLAREGWAMILCSGFDLLRYRMEKLDGEQGGSAAETRESLEEMYDRWERLTAHKCNSMADLEATSIELLGEIPRPRPRISERQEFDPGRKRFSVRYGGEDIGALLMPAFQAKRLVEEAGVPPIAGGTSLAEDLLLKSAVWLKDEMPETTLAILLRISSYEEEKVFHEFFQRHRIARLSRERVTDLVARLEQSLDYGVPRIESSADSNGDRVNYWLGRVRIAVELLSRLVLRLDGEEAERTLARAVSYYRHPTFQTHSWLTRPLKNLFRRSFEAMEPSRRQAHVYKMTSLPAPGVDGFEPSASWWPDPLQELAEAGEISPIRESSENWEQIISKLIEAVRVHPYARMETAPRLYILHRWGLLTEKERSEFARALWEYTWISGGFPHDTRFDAWAFVALPEPEPERAEVVFRVSYLSEHGTQYISSHSCPRTDSEKMFR